MIMLTNVFDWQVLTLFCGHVLVNPDGFLGLGWKAIIVIIGAIMLICGICMGPKSKGHDTKHYDAKEQNKIKHHLRAAEGGKDYAYKGSGMYRNSKGEVKKDK